MLSYSSYEYTQNDQLKGANMTTLREKIRDVIVQWDDVPNGAAHAAVNICALLNDNYDFGEKGYFKDDPDLIDILVNSDADD